MSDIAINIEKLSKRYRIGNNPAGYKTFRESITDLVSAPFRRKTRPPQNTIWALKDVTFNVNYGEVVGIIGRNGAGKSTLLKVLSRITKPTEGRVRLKGRVGSLLEVGTGFHPELTGRENIYLNGAILGMKRTEIDHKFDEIVNFAEIEKFLDTPVKFYSSGMYMRLAFAVAAHLEPEILIIDEVLAVGDAQFQKKCLGKMGEVAHAGRTVLFVSHNMGAVIQLCSRGILLDHGKALIDSTASEAVSIYIKEVLTTENSMSFPLEPDKDVQILSMAVVSQNGQVIESQAHTDDFYFLLTYRINRWNIGSYVCVDVFNENDVRLLWSSDVNSVNEMLINRDPGTYQAKIMIPGMVLSPGRYYFTSAIYAPGRLALIDAREKAISIEIIDGGSLLSNFGIKPHSATMIPLNWVTERIS